MKTRNLITAVLVAVFATASMAQAPSLENEKCNVDVQLNSKNQIVVRYMNANNEKVKVKVFNENDKLVYVRSVRDEGNIKLRFDLNTLPEGSYYFKVYQNKMELCTERVDKVSMTTLSVPERTMGKSGNTQMFTQK